MCSFLAVLSDLPCLCASIGPQIHQELVNQRFNQANAADLAIPTHGWSGQLLYLARALTFKELFLQGIN